MKQLLFDHLASAPRLLADLVRDIDPARYDREFGTGFWTIRKHLEHLVETGPVLVGRLHLLLTEPEPVITPFDPHKGSASPIAEERLPVEELLRLFATVRAEQLGIIRDGPDAVWDKPVAHPECERYSFAILVRHMVLHDGFHFARIEELGFLKPEHLNPV